MSINPLAVGDFTRPWDIGNGRNGITSRQSTAKTEAHPVVEYRGRFGDMNIECDLYAIGGQHFELITACPRCRKVNRITQERKKISWEGGKLNVEAFQCQHELEDNYRGSHGFNLCMFKMTIDNNKAVEV